MVAGSAHRLGLLEREHELGAITTAVDAVAAGRGQVIWIEGPAGIGKTSLLHAAREHAGAAGARVLWARAGALERDFAFGAVRALFEPAVTAQPGLLSAGPARFAAPVVTLVEEPSVPAVVTAARLHGLYWLTVGLADCGPLLLVLDDVQWADEPSLQALAYLARRLEDQPVGIVVAARSDMVGAGPGADVRDDPSTVLLRPGPLSEAGCERLVSATLGAPAPAFLAACQSAAGGNPLLLDALLAALNSDEVTPDEAGVDAVAGRAQEIVATFVLPRLRHLLPQAGALARAVAVLGSAAELATAARLADLDPVTAVDAAAALVAAGLLAPGRPLAFTHPLYAEAIAGRMSAAEHHRGHLRAARLLAESGADPERVAAHLLVVERLGDDWVIARLRAAAAAAFAKGAPGAAVTYLRRAVAEPCPSAGLPELLVELGTAQAAAGDWSGYQTLREAWDLCTDPRAAGAVALAMSRAARMGGRYRPAQEIVVAAVIALGDNEPDLVAELQTELALTGRIGHAPGTPTLARVGELAAMAAARGDEVTGCALRLAALNPLRDPGNAAPAAAIAARAASVASHGIGDADALYGPYPVLIATEGLDVFLAAADSVIDLAGRGGWLADLGISTSMRAHARYLLGRLPEAEQDARLADRLAAGYDPPHRRHTQTWLLHCLIERGSPAEAERELTDSGVPVTLPHLLLVRARLRLAQDRPVEALADLQECGARLMRREVRHPNISPWQPWTAVALLRLGRKEEARERAADAVAVAREFSSARAEGVALWASGLVDRSADTLAAAVAVLSRVPAPLERARALVDLGATLRRANHRSEARGPLQEGLEIAYGCGAAALADTARLELAASGVHLRRPTLTGPHALTPTERRIADLAADGASNRDIAQALFVTPKTVENHLGNAYRKLAVAGRTELAQALAPST